jgi:hypothetical protein
MRLFGLFILAISAFYIVHFTGHINNLNLKVSNEVNNVHYVDSVGSNFLFRGGLPLTKNPLAFNYNGLKSTIIDAGKNAGVKVPDAFYLIDVNLLNIEDPVDRERIYIEQQFFESNPKLGYIQVWGMVGTRLSATDPAFSASRDFLGRNLDNWLSDKLGERVELLRKWLTGSQPIVSGKTTLPIVIYVHCVAGCDRTGEFIGAYYLRYMNKSWQEMNELNQSMCHHNRYFNCRNYRADQWYCLWLNLKRGFTLNWQEEFPCSGK